MQIWHSLKVAEHNPEYANWRPVFLLHFFIGCTDSGTAKAIGHSFKAWENTMDVWCFFFIKKTEPAGELPVVLTRGKGQRLQYCTERLETDIWCLVMQDLPLSLLPSELGGLGEKWLNERGTCSALRVYLIGKGENQRSPINTFIEFFKNSSGLPFFFWTKFRKEKKSHNLYTK